jgi:hypothetical protein
VGCKQWLDQGSKRIHLVQLKFPLIGKKPISGLPVQEHMHALLFQHVCFSQMAKKFTLEWLIELLRVVPKIAGGKMACFHCAGIGARKLSAPCRISRLVELRNACQSHSYGHLEF